MKRGKARLAGLLLSSLLAMSAQTSRWELRGVLQEGRGTRYFLFDQEAQSGDWFSLKHPPLGAVLHTGLDADTVWIESPTGGRQLLRLKSGRVCCPRAGGMIGGVLINPSQADLDEQRAAIAVRVQSDRERYAAQLAMETAARR